MKKILLFISSLFLFLTVNINVNAQVVDYQFMGITVDNTFSVSSGSSSTGKTYFVVTSDSTAKYLVVDLCSTVGTAFTTYVPTDFDGSYTSFYKMYDLGASCSTGSYTGNSIRLFYLISTFADAGNGNYAINNTMQFTNNASYTGVFKLISIGLADTIDLGDLTINNQNTIINNINNINSSISSTEENITNEINDMEESINDTITDNFNTCTPSDNLIDYTNPTTISTRKFTYSYNSNSYLFTLTSLETSSGGNFPVGWVTNLSPNSTYTLSWNVSKSNSNTKTFFYVYDTDWSSNLVAYSEGSNLLTFTTTSNTTYYIQFYVTGSYSLGDTISLSNIMLNTGSTAKSFETYGEVCKNKIDATNDKLDQTNQQLGELNNNLNDSDTSEATNQAGDFFSGFQTDTFGLTSIITAPLNLIGSITSSSCSPLGLQVPFVENTTLNLPCMTSIYQSYFDSFLSVYQTITFGIVAYWVCVRIFALVKDFKNPDHDEIEVLDL